MKDRLVKRKKILSPCGPWLRFCQIVINLWATRSICNQIINSISKGFTKLVFGKENNLALRCTDFADGRTVRRERRSCFKIKGEISGYFQFYRLELLFHTVKSRRVCLSIFTCWFFFWHNLLNNIFVIFIPKRNLLCAFRIWKMHYQWQKISLHNVRCNCPR